MLTYHVWYMSSSKSRAWYRLVAPLPRSKVTASRLHLTLTAPPHWEVDSSQYGARVRRVRTVREKVEGNMVSLRARPALVGRRFIAVTGPRGSNTPKLKNCPDWDWRGGWIRSSTSGDPADPELQVRHMWAGGAWRWSQHWLGALRQHQHTPRSPGLR